MRLTLGLAAYFQGNWLQSWTLWDAFLFLLLPSAPISAQGALPSPSPALASSLTPSLPTFLRCWWARPIHHPVRPVWQPFINAPQWAEISNGAALSPANLAKQATSERLSPSVPAIEIGKLVLLLFGSADFFIFIFKCTYIFLPPCIDIYLR